MKEKTESIKKNYLYNTLYKVLTMIIPLITAPYISRVIGSEGVGIYSYTNSNVTYFILFAALGTTSYGEREIAMHRDNPQEASKLFWEIELLSLATTGVATAAWLIWTILSKQYTVYYLVLTLSVIAVAFDISWYFAGYEKFKYIAIRNTLVKVAGTILLFVFVRAKSDTLLYVGILAATGLLGNISMWTYLPKLLSKIDFHDLHPFRKHLKQTFAYFIPAIATSVYTVLDKTMIGAITNSKSQNGYYEQATKIITMIESLLFSLNTVMSARQAYLFSTGKTDEIKDKINTSFEFLFALGIPFMFGVAGIAKNFVPWFFGKGFDPVIKILWVMSPLPLVITVSNILGSQYLTPSGQRVRSSKGIIAGAVTNLVLNSVMIPKYGAVGATVASVIAESVISIIYMHMSKGYAAWSQLFHIASKKFIAGIIMFAVVILIGGNASGSILISILQIVIGALVYGIVLVIMKDNFAKNAINMVRGRLHG